MNPDRVSFNLATNPNTSIPPGFENAGAAMGFEFERGSNFYPTEAERYDATCIADPHTNMFVDNRYNSLPGLEVNEKQLQEDSGVI
jgi:hypothetical protein